MNGVFVVGEGGHLLFRKAYGADLGLGACDGDAINLGAVLAALHAFAQGVVDDADASLGTEGSADKGGASQCDSGLAQYEARGACVIFRRSAPFALGGAPRPGGPEAPPLSVQGGRVVQESGQGTQAGKASPAGTI